MNRLAGTLRGVPLTVPTFNSILEESGTVVRTSLTPRQLQEQKVDKSELNPELIRDFVLLTNARSDHLGWDFVVLEGRSRRQAEWREPDVVTPG